MNRRRWIALTAAGLGTAIAGCTAGGDGSPTASATASDPESERITGEEPTLDPGESIRLRVTATSVTGLHLGVPLDEDDVDFSANDAAVSPTPDRQLDSYPPQWRWDQCVDVAVEVPVAVAADARPGEYTYSVTARPCETDRDQIDHEFTVIVAGD